MTTDQGAVAPYSGGGSPDVVSPTAIAGAKSSAAYGLAQTLITLVHAVPMAFHSENGVDAAVNAINAFVGAFVSSSEMPALAGQDVRAAKEDVSLRIPPGGAPTVQYGGPPLDYDKLAAAILAAQARQSQKAVE